MSESTGAMEQFNINELAGATGLILGAVSGILVVIFKSRCFCKFRVGISDKYSLCMCERKPPPDIKEDSEEEDKKDKKVDDKKVDDKKVDRSSKELKEPEPEPEPILPPQNP
tara:strand:- start:4132 stop:4467 length:336 start_codon:yes stop_codon:yes gene_type:complete